MSDNFKPTRFTSDISYVWNETTNGERREVIVVIDDDVKLNEYFHPTTATKRRPIRRRKIDVKAC